MILFLLIVHLYSLFNNIKSCSLVVFISGFMMICLSFSGQLIRFLPLAFLLYLEYRSTAGVATVYQHVYTEKIETSLWKSNGNRLRLA